MREKNDDDICFPGDKIPYRPASRNIIVYKNPCLDKRGERKETDGTIFRRIVTGVGSPDKPGGLSIQLCKSEKKEFYIRYSS